MTLMAKLLAATLIVGLPIRVEAGAHVAAAKLLFPKEHATSFDNRVVPKGPLVDHYNGDDDTVCTVSEHGSLSPGCVRHHFRRAALDLRRPHAAEHHPMA
mmetsp:Transcript_17834/g.54843  ORF Transcript_17834/g.54843 Transcript_17834/m.54843 type:complete len:100 (-) Transcript_17834:123-422(-)